MRDIEPLIQYIEQNRSEGVSDEEIKTTLLQDGTWSEEEISLAVPSDQSESENTFSLLKIVIVAVILSMFGAGGFFAYKADLFTPQKTFADVLVGVSEVQTYRQSIEIEVGSEEQILLTKGEVEVNVLENKALSSMTTSGSGWDLSQNVIVDGDSVYVKIDINSPLLAELLAFPDGWIMFGLSNVPEQYESLLESERYTDTLSLFNESGEYIESVIRSDVVLGGDEAIKYTVTVSEESLDGVADKSLRDFLELMSGGVTEVWVDDSSHMVEKIAITTDELKLTSQIITVNESVEIAIPESFMTMEEWDTKRFVESLQKEQITEVSIGGYGGVSDHTMELIQKTIADETGVKVSISGNYEDGFPEIPGVFNEERQQFDADVVWQYLGSLMKESGNTYRYLVVLNNDMYTEVQPEREYVLSRSSPGMNTALISVNRLDPESDLYDKRVKKLSLRTLGVASGLTRSPDSKNTECVMYQFGTVEELDVVGDSYCGATRGAFSSLFKSVE